MPSIGSLDLEFLYLGIQKGGSFDEKDIENSELSRLGVGRVLDSIASLKDRKLIVQNDDGTFSITNSSKQILWNDEIPLWVKILRLLEIKPYPQRKISKFLNVDSEKILSELEIMRKNELVLMSPLRTDSGLEKMFEIMPTGVEQLDKINSEGYDNAQLVFEKSDEKKDIFDIIEELKEIIKSNEIDDSVKTTIIEKLEKIKSRLKI